MTPATNTVISGVDDALARLQQELAVAQRDGDAARIAAIQADIDAYRSTGLATYPGGTFGGTPFQTGSMNMGGPGGICIYVQNMYVGSSGQAQSFFQQLYDYVSSGGEGLEKFRDLVCAATPA